MKSVKNISILGVYAPFKTKKTLPVFSDIVDIEHWVKSKSYKISPIELASLNYVFSKNVKVVPSHFNSNEEVLFIQLCEILDKFEYVKNFSDYWKSFIRWL
jgi:hypothetical protein